jgi:hypothetical protein
MAHPQLVYGGHDGEDYSLELWLWVRVKGACCVLVSRIRAAFLRFCSRLIGVLVHGSSSPHVVKIGSSIV